MPVVPKFKLLVDANRDGLADDKDALVDRSVWTNQVGAVFLPNIDDDSKRCSLKDANGKALSDDVLATCSDASDDFVNGAQDVLDLSPVVIPAWPEASTGATAKLSISPADRVRVFKKLGATNFPKVDLATEKLTATDLKAGVEFAIEGLDVVRDAAVWDGFIEIVLTVEVPSNGDLIVPGTYTDKVRMRVSPFMTFHHLSPSETTYVSLLSGGFEGQASAAFRSALKTAVNGVSPAVVEPATDDPWMQDFVETAYMSKPGAGGAQHVMRVFLRAANWYGAQYGLREAGRLAFTKFRGPDVAGIQQYLKSTPQSMQSLNSYGNLETVPPYTHNGKSYPLGRRIRGNVPSFYTDKSFTRLLESQGNQKHIDVDTSWLVVSHIDETVSFVKAPSTRGWAMLVADPRLARKMLEKAQADGFGASVMHKGKIWGYDDNNNVIKADITINDVLNDTDIMAKSEMAAVEIDAQVAIIKQETGLLDSEIVPIPFLFMDTDGALIAYQPGMVNGLVVDSAHMVSPDPFGPIINGKDMFKAAVETAVAPLGVSMKWVDDWDLYHVALGEVHCGTNSMRKIPDTKWWENMP